MRPKRHIISPVLILFLLIFIPSLSLASIARETQKNVISNHRLNITVDIEDGIIRGSDTLSLSEEVYELHLFMRYDSMVDKIEADDKRLNFDILKHRKENANEIVVKVPGLRKLTVFFHGSFHDIEKAREGIRRGVAYVDDGAIGEEGAFLPSSALWYPQEAGGLTMFDATITTPEEYTSITEGEWLKSSKEKGNSINRWSTEAPVDGLDLVVSRYVVEEANHKGVDIYTFFFEKNPSLSKTYIEKTKDYLDLYQDLIGPYPFRKFAVVENFLPTGYGMPSFTLLGSSVLKLPFIPDTSLGHEIAHNWWGNSVYVNDSLGNWTEALTTYTSDYLYAKRSGEQEALEFRLSKLRGYKNFASTSDLALKDFIDSTTIASRAVGYNKGTMVFNMLNSLIGDEAFRAGLKGFYKSNAFKKASWADIKAAFEVSSGRDLDWFFNQWVNRAGGPEISIMDADYKKTAEGKYLATIKIRQQSTVPYRLKMPVLFRTNSGTSFSDITLSKEVEEVRVELDSTPTYIEIDPNYETFRILADKEIPPSFASFFGDKNSVIVVPGKSKQNKYLPAAEVMANDYNIELANDSKIGISDYIYKRSVFVMGGAGENSLFWLTGQYLTNRVTVTPEVFKIEGKTYPRAGTVLAIAIKNPKDMSKTLCFFIGDKDEDGMLEAGKRLRYFSESSYVVFSRDGKVDKGIFPIPKVLSFNFDEQ